MIRQSLTWDLLSLKRLLVASNGARLPWNKYTEMRTGLRRDTMVKQRPKKCSDDTIDASMENLAGKLGQQTEIWRPETTSMDDERLKKKAKFEEAKADAEAAAEASCGKDRPIEEEDMDLDPATDSED